MVAELSETRVGFVMIIIGVQVWFPVAVAAWKFSLPML